MIRATSCVYLRIVAPEGLRATSFDWRKRSQALLTVAFSKAAGSLNFTSSSWLISWARRFALSTMPASDQGPTCSQHWQPFWRHLKMTASFRRTIVTRPTLSIFFWRLRSL